MSVHLAKEGQGERGRNTVSMKGRGSAPEGQRRPIPFVHATRGRGLTLVQLA